MTACDSHIDEENLQTLRKCEEGRELVLKLDNLRGAGTESGRTFLSAPFFLSQPKSELTSRAPPVAERRLEVLDPGRANLHVKGKPVETSFSQPEEVDEPSACYHLDQPCTCYHLDQAHHPHSSLGVEDGNVQPETSNVLLSENMIDVEKNSEELRAEKDVLSSLYHELEEERNAAATAANEAISMISRLQNEKAVLQMEARHYRQRVEEKSFYDQEVITLLKEIILKQEADKLALENEIKLYRERLLKYSISKMKEATPPNNEADEVFHELLATSDEEETLTSKGIPDSAEESLIKDLPLERDSEGPAELFELQKTFHKTGQLLKACEPWFPMHSGHHPSDEARADSMLSVLNIDVESRCLDVDVKDVVVQNPVRTKAQDIILDEFESAPLKWVDVKVDAFIEEADDLDAVMEKHWQVVVEQLWKLEEQIGNLRAIQLSDFKEHPWFVKDQQRKNSSFNDQCRNRKQQKESPGVYRNSRLKQNEKTRRSVKKWTGTMGKGLPEVKSRSKFHVECSSDVLEDERSNCLLVDDFKFCKFRRDTKHRSMHPLNIKGEFDNRLAKLLMGMESSNLRVKTTVDHPKPVAGGKRVFFTSNDKNERTCEQAKKNKVLKSEQCCYAASLQKPDMCRITLEGKVENCQSRLQALGTGGNKMTEAIETIKQNLGRTDAVHEVAQKSHVSEEWSRLVEKRNCQPQVAKFAADLSKGFLLFTSLGYNILDLSSNLARCLQHRVGLVEDMCPLDTFYSSEVETCTTSYKHDATPFSKESDFQINKQASLSSTDLTWLNNVQGRSGTAFAGWDL